MGCLGNYQANGTFLHTRHKIWKKATRNWWWWRRLNVSPSRSAIRSNTSPQKYLQELGHQGCWWILESLQRLRSFKDEKSRNKTPKTTMKTTNNLHMIKKQNKTKNQAQLELKHDSGRFPSKPSTFNLEWEKKLKDFLTTKCEKT